jgi:hypothetical protein
MAVQPAGRILFFARSVFVTPKSRPAHHNEQDTKQNKTKQNKKPTMPPHAQ